MTAPSLTSLLIENLRGAVAPFSLAFEKGRRLTIVYGENGTGKSTISDAFDLLGNGNVGSLEKRGVGGATRSYWPSVRKTHSDVKVALATSEDEARSVLDRDRRLIAREIHAQMMAHFWEQATSYEVQISRGFTELKPCNYTVTAGQTAHHFRETLAEPGRIKQMLFGGFARCLYPLQKFDSDTERRFSIILERDAQKWFKPAKGQFQVYYKLGTEQPEYIPDFVAETDSMIFMIETKARADIDTQEVQAKAAAAARWCILATDHAKTVEGKPWKYLLLPHDEISESKRLVDFSRFEVKA